MKQLITIVLFILLGGKLNNVTAQQETWKSNETIRFFNCIYNFSFESCDSSIMVQNTTLPDYYRYFLIANSKWWMLVTTDNKQYYSECLAGVLNGTESLEKANIAYHEKNFLKICYEAYRLRLMLYDKQYVKAYSQSKAVTGYIEPVLDLEKTFIPYYLTSGLYHYFGSAGREKYPLLFKDKKYKTASKVVGLGYLETCAKSDVAFLSNEANYYLMKIYLEVEENNEKALSYSNRLVKSFSNNVLYQYYHLNILLNLKRTIQVNEQYQLVLKKIEENQQLNNEQKSHLKEITDQLYNNKK